MTRAALPATPAMGALVAASLLSVFLIGLLLYLPQAAASADEGRPTPDADPDGQDDDAPDQSDDPVDDPAPTVGLVFSTLGAAAALLWVRHL